MKLPADHPPSRGFRLPRIYPALLCAMILLSLCACRSMRLLPPPKVSEIHVLTMPLALNLDDIPGADGFALKVYANYPDDPKTQRIQNGTLDILMFDGVINSLRTTNTPLATWSYPARDLVAFQFQTTIGVGYAFTPAWTTNVPRQSKVTVGVRYTPPEGPPLYSSPNPILVSQ